jgi:hypothetical protein
MAKWTALRCPRPIPRIPSRTELSGPTRTEQELLPIVSALLNVDRINPGDNFFLLGRHSLLGASERAKPSSP